MSSVTSALTRAGMASIAMLIATFGIAALAPEAVAEVKGNLMGIEDEGPADNYSRDCKADAIDPVGVLFRGEHAKASNAAFETGRLTGWTYEGLGPQRLKVRAPGGGYVCNPVQAQPASEPDFRFAPPEVPQTRDHMRLWFIPATKNAEKLMTVGTPHREDFIEHDPTGISDHCEGLFSIPWGALDIAPGSHAVKKGGKGTEEVSGFDQARHVLREAFEKSRHKVVPENWGNDDLIEQCDEDFAGSDGVGLIIGLDGVNAGQTGRPSTRQSSALLRGRLVTTEEGSTDWWFEYGATSSQGAGSYPNKTAVKSISGNAEVDVSRAISALSPGTTYYVRMFARDEEGEVEEGNEVQFETCGWENTDEDDNSRGPRAATPECGGVVDTVYRDVNGDLGHQSWSAEGNWSTETRPASIARGATPRVFHRSDGSGVVDVFYRDVDGHLGHHWWTPGSGWQAETRAASIESDPNVVSRPDGTIDVFYRASGDELGHEWLVPGSGWSSETRSAVMSSDPHAVAHENGELDVFYRSGSGLGRDHWAPEGGWSHEVRSGSLVAEPRPIAGESGAVDVFYRTTEDELGHDWFVPGTGWSREARSESLASDPHVVSRPDDTIDVFYRTSGDELGHDWWVSGTGWSTETRPGHLSSDPHVVARSDGSVEVFYRDGNRIGHQWYVSGTGWSVETLRGPIASHTDPHVVTQSNGRIDVLYETPTEQLGRDWCVPGRGWSHEVRAMRRPSPPVATYSFDEGEGETVADLTDNGHTATIKGAQWTAKGRYGGAMEFDVADQEDILKVPDADDLDLTEDFTLEAWVRPLTERDWATVIGKEHAEESSFSYLLYSQAESGGPGVALRKGAKTTEEFAEGPLPIEAWSHIALTSDGSKARLYVDGVLVKTSESFALPGTDGDLSIGGNGIWGEYFDGRIDEVRIYDRALSAAEIEADRISPLQTPQTTPVAAYSFDEGEGEGTTVEDLTGDGHTGTIEGAEWTKGRYGNSLKFDGEGMMTIPASEDLNLTEEFTLEAWIKPEAECEFGQIFVKEDAAEEHSAYVIAKHGSRLAAYLGVPGVEAESSPGTVELGVWQHVAVTYSGAQARLYVNGHLVQSDAAMDVVSTDGALRIGGSNIWGPGDDFTGRIDEVRVYNRALSAAEIGADRAAPLETPPATPVAAYAFDEGEGETLLDLAGENDGTVEGATWVPGKYGSSLRFDGEGDCVTVPNSAALGLGEEFTIEAWAKADYPLAEDPIIFKESEGSYSYTLGLGFSETGKAEGWVGEEGGEATESVVSTEALEPNVWTHLALTYDGSKLRLYVNGALAATKSLPGITLASEGPLTIGCAPAFEEAFRGRIDEIRIYQRALEAGEVAGDRAAPLQTPSATPVAAYAFDENEGALAADLSGNEHDGTVEGAQWSRGKYGSSLGFAGEEGECVTVPDSAELGLGEEFTIEAWAKADYPLAEDPIVFKESEGSYSYTLGLGFSETGKAEGWVGEEGGEKSEHVTSPKALEPNVWTHLALTYDGSHMRLYVDGELVGTKSLPGISLASEGPLQIGCDEAFEETFRGRIDEVRLYQRALEAGEVAGDRATPLQTPPTHPVAAYAFDEGEGETAFDFAGENDGAVEGAAWAPGKYGSSLRFDGEEECVTVPDSADLGLGEEFTIEAWAKADYPLAADPIVFKESEGSYSYTLGLGFSETGKAEGWVGEEGGEATESVVSTEALEPNVWTHLAFTYDGSKLRLYVNGVLAATKSLPGITLASEGPMTIGCAPAFEEAFRGRIDEVRIYQRALEAGEVAEF